MKIFQDQEFKFRKRKKITVRKLDLIRREKNPQKQPFTLKIWGFPSF